MKGSQSVRNGWKAYSQGNHAQAEAEFSKAIDESPKAAYPNLQRGLYLLRRDRFSEASRDFEGAALLEPSNPAALFFLTLSRELEGEAALADGSLERLMVLCPRHQGLASLRLLKEMRRGDPLPTLTQLGFGDAPVPGGRSESWRALAAGIGIGDPAWLPPDLSSSSYLLGPVLVEVEKRLLPREIPELEHRPNSLLAELEGPKPPRRGLAEELRALGPSLKSGPKLRKGRRLLERAMGVEEVEEQRTELGKAIALLEEGRALDPYAFRTSYHLGEACLFSAKSTPGAPYLREYLMKAEEHFIDSARQDGLNPYVLFYLALISQLLGRPNTAIEGYAKATEKFTKLPEAHYGTGQCHLLLGRQDLAREFLLQAVSSDLALARERLNLFANLLQQEGAEAFLRPLPSMPPEPPPEADLQKTEPLELAEAPDGVSEPQPAEVVPETEGEPPGTPA